jgi:hypothetical protein
MKARFIWLRMRCRDIFFENWIMKSMVFWVVTLCSAERARRFGGRCLLQLQGRRVSQARNHLSLLLLVSSLAMTQKMEEWCSSETPGCGRSTRRYSPEDRPLHTHRRENIKCDIRYLIHVIIALLLFSYTIEHL